jgi:Ca2+-binding RTX toxin-like protein
LLFRGLFHERLEDRRVLATLTVTGTAGNDSISAWVAGDQLNVNVNGAVFSVPSSAFDHIKVLGVAGDDRIKMDTTVTQVAELDGGDGNDSLAAGGATAIMHGGNGDDTLLGGRHSDVLFGGAGNDSIAGGGSDDYLIGGAGNDKLAGGDGNDWLFGDATNAWPANVVDPVQYAIHYADINFGVDSLSGGAGHDILLAGNGNDRAGGDDGNDVVVGGVGNDSLGGGAGHDIILGDTLFRLANADRDAADSIRRVNAAAEPILTVDAVAATDPTVLRTFNDVIEAGDGDDVVLGQLGNDSIGGGGGADYLNGGAGNDSLNGGNDNDHLSGGAGNDSLLGGAGDDTAFGGEGERVDWRRGQRLPRRRLGER